MNMGFVTMMLPNSVNENLLSWQLISSSYAHVNKPFEAIKCGSEDIA